MRIHTPAVSATDHVAILSPRVKAEPHHLSLTSPHPVSTLTQFSEAAEVLSFHGDGGWKNY